MNVALGIASVFVAYLLLSALCLWRGDIIIEEKEIKLIKERER